MGRRRSDRLSLNGAEKLTLVVGSARICSFRPFCRRGDQALHKFAESCGSDVGNQKTHTRSEPQPDSQSLMSKARKRKVDWRGDSAEHKTHDPRPRPMELTSGVFDLNHIGDAS